MSDSNAVQFAYVRESAYGTDPGSNLRAVPRVDGGIQPAHEATRSNQVRSDRQLASTRRVEKLGRAQIGYELSAQNYDEFLRGAILSSSDWSTAVAFSGTLSSVASTSKFTGTAVNTNAYVGQWVYVDGLHADVNGWHRITATGSGEITVASTLTDQTGDGDETVKGSYILNGTTLGSYLLQEHFTDNTTDYQYALGMCIERLSMQLAKGALITGQVSWQGQPPETASACQGSGTVTDAYDEDPGTEVENFDGIYVDDTLLTVDVTDFGLDLSVPLRPRRGLGDDEPTSYGFGALNSTGSMALYREDDTATYLTKYLAFTSMRVAVALNMGNDDRYLIEWPRAVFTSPPSMAPGLDQDVMLDFDWSAEPGGAFGADADEKTIVINRVQGS